MKKLVKESLISEAVTPKDIQRIEDMFRKSAGDDEKLLRLAQTQANLIKDYNKATARAEAAEQLIGVEDNPVADIFRARAEEISGGVPMPAAPSRRVAKPAGPSLPAQNPPLKRENLPEASGKYLPEGVKGFIYLPNGACLAIWDWEITGQLSDGAWENTRPYDHWKFWSDLQPVLGDPEVISIGYPLKTSYNLTGLLEYIGDRMVQYGKFGRANGEKVLELGSEVRSVIEDLPKEPVDLASFKEEMIRKYDYREKDYYWKGLTQEMIDNYYATTYTERDLRADLRLIKQAMKSVS